MYVCMYIKHFNFPRIRWDGDMEESRKRNPLKLKLYSRLVMQLAIASHFRRATPSYCCKK